MPVDNFVDPMQKIFIRSLVSITQTLNLIQDGFFKEKFCVGIESLLNNYLTPGPGSGVNVAQYLKDKELLNTVNYLLESLDNLKHLNLADTASLLESQKNLLELKLFIIRRIKLKTVENASNAAKKEDLETAKTIDYPKKKYKSRNREKILNFIKNKSKVRTRDILSEFSALPRRTVKRNLKDLIDEGAVEKAAGKKSMFYSVIAKTNL